MVICLYSCSNIEISDITCKDSGGDGIYIGSSGAGQNYCENISISDDAQYPGAVVKCVPAYRSLANCFPQAQSDWLVDFRFAGAIYSQLNGGSVVPVFKTLSFRKLLKI